MTYAFSFDARFCSGCKACQAACKDKNQLPVGVLWRRVVEVSGGEWQKTGDTWTHTVFAYNLSVACHHCAHPKCAGVCPTNAYAVRDNGAVVLDTTRCMGCGYCAWACPYGAPQYDPEAGHMTKCDLCCDQLEQGLPPACVAACPLRVLDYRETTAQDNGALALWELPGAEHPFPLPVYSRTEPHLAIRPHPAMNNALEKTVANVEEIAPRAPSAWEEAPLMLFTLLGQMAVGAFWATLWMFPAIWLPAGWIASPAGFFPALLPGGILGVSALASFAHLGAKRNAWRALTHLSHSWLSREILFLMLFGCGWLLSVAEGFLFHRFTIETGAVTAVLGLGLVYSMAQVYRLKAAPGWNSWRTNAGFLLSALLLGTSLMASVLTYGPAGTGVVLSAAGWRLVPLGILSLLLAQLALTHRTSSNTRAVTLRLGSLLAAIALAAFSALLPPKPGLALALFLVIAAEESLGRWAFYQQRTTASPR